MIRRGKRGTKIHTNLFGKGYDLSAKSREPLLGLYPGCSGDLLAVQPLQLRQPRYHVRLEPRPRLPDDNKRRHDRYWTKASYRASTEKNGPKRQRQLVFASSQEGKSMGPASPKDRGRVKLCALMDRNDSQTQLKIELQSCPCLTEVGSMP